MPPNFYDDLRRIYGRIRVRRQSGDLPWLVETVGGAWPYRAKAFETWAEALRTAFPLILP